MLGQSHIPCVGASLLTLFIASAALAAPTPSPTPDPTHQTTQLQILAAEIADLSARVEQGGTKSALTFGGYGELFMGHSLGDVDERAAHRADTYRLVLEPSYRFSDRVRMRSEIEFEHASSGANPANGKTGTIAVEMLTIDVQLLDTLTFRTGLVLMPMGLINRQHEPTAYLGNMRPTTERRVIPSTWRETGVGVLGEVAGVRYEAYLVSGLSAEGFSDTGVRGGRQSGNHVVWEDKALVLSLEQAIGTHLTLGGSVYYGGADQDQHEATEVAHLIYEAHTTFSWGRLLVRGLFAGSSTTGADALSTDDAVVPEQQWGYYVEAAYTVLQAEQFGGWAVTPFARFEQLDLNASVPSGYETTDTLRLVEATGGLELRPHPQVAFKVEVHRAADANDDNPARTEARFGVGYAF